MYDYECIKYKYRINFNSFIIINIYLLYYPFKFVMKNI